MARKRSQRQIEKNERTRRDLLRAALKVVGRQGYARASIGKIAEVAGVSTGTFYLHFKSKDHIYEVLLPHANVELTEFISQRVGGAVCYMDFEERNIRGFFEYVELNPWFLTVLIEAETLAPKAWRDYTTLREGRYLEFLDAAWLRGEFPDYPRNAMTQVGRMLVALRREIVKRHFERGARGIASPDETISTYLRFVFGALHRTNVDAILAIWRPARASARIEFLEPPAEAHEARQRYGT